LIIEAGAGLAAVFITIGTETLVVRVVPLTVASIVGTGAAPVLTVVWPTDSEASIWLFMVEVDEVVAFFEDEDEDTPVPFTVQKADARRADLTAKLDSSLVTFMLKKCSELKGIFGKRKVCSAVRFNVNIQRGEDADQQKVC
jgi:hypothetical protein